MKDKKVTVYWYANGIRVVVGEHHFGDVDQNFSTSREFDSLKAAADQLQPTNRAQPTIRHMLESMK